MSFLESPRFPDYIAKGAQRAPGYFTTLTRNVGGYEQSSIWLTYPTHEYNIGSGIDTADVIEDLNYFFHVMGGKGHRFRFKDWFDYKSCGILEDYTAWDTDIAQLIGVGTGAALQELQLIKTYEITGASPALTRVRQIRKPVSGTVKVGWNGAWKTITTDWTVTTTTGIVTLVNGYSGNIYAGYEFDVPVRFDTDKLPATTPDFNILEATNIPIIEVRV